MYENPKRYEMPKTVDEVVDLLASDLMTTHREALTQMGAEAFEELYATVAAYIIEEFGLWTGNEELLASCMEEPLSDEVQAVDPARVILEKVRNRIQEDVGAVIIT